MNAGDSSVQRFKRVMREYGVGMALLVAPRSVRGAEEVQRMIGSRNSLLVLATSAVVPLRGRMNMPKIFILGEYAALDKSTVVTAQAQGRFARAGNFVQKHKARLGYGLSSLSDQDEEILGWVIDTSARKTWNDFIRLVYSTYPIMSQDRGTQLDLVDLALEYKSEELVEF